MFKACFLCDLDHLPHIYQTNKNHCVETESKQTIYWHFIQIKYTTGSSTYLLEWNVIENWKQSRNQLRCLLSPTCPLTPSPAFQIRVKYPLSPYKRCFQHEHDSGLRYCVFLSLITGWNHHIIRITISFEIHECLNFEFYGNFTAIYDEIEGELNRRDSLL